MIAKFWKIFNVHVGIACAAIFLIGSDLAYARDQHIRCVSDALQALFDEPDRKPAPIFTQDPYSPENVTVRSKSNVDFYDPEKNTPERAVHLPAKADITVSQKPYVASKTEHFERYVSEQEASGIFNSHHLELKKGHLQSSKWISLQGKVDPRTLGKSENYTYKIEIDTDPGTLSWLSKFETKKANEPGRFEIPPTALEEFNQHILHLKITRR